MSKTDVPFLIVKELAKLLKQAREDKKVSKNELSQRCGLSRAAIRAIENEEKQPSIYSLLKIADGLDLKLWKLIKEATDAV